MLKKFSLIAFGMMLASLSWGQNEYTLEDARADLNRLKSGMLLVRLKTSSAAISALEQAGKTEESEELRAYQYEENRESLLSFGIFDFCPVYFFYSDKSDQIRQGDLSGVLFNADMKLIEDVSKLPEFYLTAEFAETPQLGIDGFIVMAKDLIPLEAPFPFFQREHTFFGLVSLSKAQMIERYNAKLWGTYQLWFPTNPSN